jgi:hypothetical protein
MLLRDAPFVLLYYVLQKALFIYYIYSLELFCSLCYGRNGGAQQDLQAASAAYGLGLEFDALVQMVSRPTTIKQ